MLPSILYVNDPQTQVGLIRVGNAIDGSVNGSNRAPVPTMAQSQLQMEGIGDASNDAFGWELVSREVAVLVGTNATARATRTLQSVESDGISLSLPLLPVGRSAVRIQAAGQEIHVAASDGILVGCRAGYYGHPGEFCSECPEGSTCDGFTASSAATSDGRGHIEFGSDGGAFRSDLSNGTTSIRPLVVEGHAYPVSMAGYYDLARHAGTVCPLLAQVSGPTLGPSLTKYLSAADPAALTRNALVRPVCIAPCVPASACDASNSCMPGYRGSSPLYRCSDCSSGYNRMLGGCVQCPSYSTALTACAVLVSVTAMCGLLWAAHSPSAVTAPIILGIEATQIVSVLPSVNVYFPEVVQPAWRVL